MTKIIALLLLSFLLLPFQLALAAGSRLTRATTTTAAYGYGAFSERLQKTLASGQTRTYLGELAEVDSSGVFTDYLFAGKLRIASRDQSGLYYSRTNFCCFA